MDIREVLDRVRDQMNDTVTVRRVFGEAYIVGDKTIIPVARIGFGMGAGAGPSKAEDARAGGGGGGGAQPVGVVEVTREQTRFIPFSDKRKLAGAAIAGLALGWFLARRRS